LAHGVRPIARSARADHTGTDLSCVSLRSGAARGAAIAAAARNVDVQVDTVLGAFLRFGVFAFRLQTSRCKAGGVAHAVPAGRRRGTGHDRPNGRRGGPVRRHSAECRRGADDTVLRRGSRPDADRYGQNGRNQTPATRSEGMVQRRTRLDGVHLLLMRARTVVAASPEGALLLALGRSAAMASSSLSRCPTAATPSSFRVSRVRLSEGPSRLSRSRGTQPHTFQGQGPPYRD